MSGGRGRTGRHPLLHALLVVAAPVLLPFKLLASVAAAVAILVPSVAVRAVVSVGVNPQTRRRELRSFLPELAVRVIPRIWALPRVGPRVKAVATLCVAPAAVLLYPALILAATGFALFRGYAAIERPLGKTVAAFLAEAAGHHRQGARFVAGVLDRSRDRPLGPGEEPFDISFAGALVGLAGGALGLAVAATVTGALAVLYAGPVGLRVTRDFWRSVEPGPLVVYHALVYAFGLAAGVVAVLASVPVAGLYGLLAGCRTAYRQGLGRAVAEILGTAGEARAWLHERAFR